MPLGLQAFPLDLNWWKNKKIHGGSEKGTGSKGPQSGSTGVSFFTIIFLKNLKGEVVNKKF